MSLSTSKLFIDTKAIFIHLLHEKQRTGLDKKKLELEKQVHTGWENFKIVKLPGSLKWRILSQPTRIGSGKKIA